MQQPPNNTHGGPPAAGAPPPVAAAPPPGYAAAPPPGYVAAQQQQTPVMVQGSETYAQPAEPQPAPQQQQQQQQHQQQQQQPGVYSGAPPAGVGTKRAYEGDAAAAGAHYGGYEGAGHEAKRQQVEQAPAAQQQAGSQAPPLYQAQPAAGAPQQQQAPQGAPQRAHMGAAGVSRQSVYRLVVDVVAAGHIIGRGGITVRTIEQATGGRVKRMQEPPGTREQTIIIYSSAKELPAPGRAKRNVAQEALMDCVRRLLFDDAGAPRGDYGSPATLQLLIGRTQERGVLDNMDALLHQHPGVTLELRRAQELPACALDNDVLLALRGADRGTLLGAVEVLSHVLREHPIMEKPGGAPPALLRAGGGVPAPGQAPAPGGYAPPARAY